MTRVTSRIRHDEVKRLIKAIQSQDLPIARVRFDGDNVDVFIGDSGETLHSPVDQGVIERKPIREPKV